MFESFLSLTSPFRFCARFTLEGERCDHREGSKRAQDPRAREGAGHQGGQGENLPQLACDLARQIVLIGFVPFSDSDAGARQLPQAGEREVHCLDGGACQLQARQRRPACSSTSIDHQLPHFPFLLLEINHHPLHSFRSSFLKRKSSATKDLPKEAPSRSLEASSLLKPSNEPTSRRTSRILRRRRRVLRS